MNETSNTDLLINAHESIRAMIRQAISDTVYNQKTEMVSLSYELPFGRAESKDYFRIVELWNEYKSSKKIRLPSRPCPACQALEGHPLFVSYDSYLYHTCPKCNTWYVPELVDDSVIANFFSVVPEARQISDSMMVGREVQTKESDRQRFSEYFRLTEPLFEVSANSTRYLDIGCGVGHSVELAQELGWNSLGVEVNKPAIETAQNHGRKVIHPDELNNSSEFDLISLFETLEHLTDPDPIIEKAASILAPLGVVVFTIPNRDSFEISILRERSFHVFGGSESVGHINLFNRESLGILLERHGLSLMHTDGQYGSDTFQTFFQMVSSKYSILEVAQEGEIKFDIPEVVHVLLNNIGPAFSLLERTLKRSPILLAIACRDQDKPALQKKFQTIEENRQQEIINQLDKI